MRQLESGSTVLVWPSRYRPLHAAAAAGTRAGRPPAAASSTGSGGAKVDPATAADIRGSVTVDGAVPENVASR